MDITVSLLSFSFSCPTVTSPSRVWPVYKKRQALLLYVVLHTMSILNRSRVLLVHEILLTATSTDCIKSYSMWWLVKSFFFFYESQCFHLNPVQPLRTLSSSPQRLPEPIEMDTWHLSEARGWLQMRLFPAEKKKQASAEPTVSNRFSKLTENENETRGSN